MNLGEMGESSGLAGKAGEKGAGEEKVKYSFGREAGEKGGREEKVN